ncbi:MAG: SDR family oxidoreductase [Chloroflexi bacterium]|nr:SDR family oxidoreductase [Chloroflexota bacterium]
MTARRYAGRVCLVTGSTGIAAASAKRFAAEGGQVLVASRTEDHCRELVEAIRASGGEAAYETANLSKEGAAERAVAAAVERFGRIDAVFNVAGGSGRRFGDGPIHEATPAGWDATLELNLRSQYLMCHAAIRRMLEQERDAQGMRGAILNMGSILAFHPSPAHFPTHAYAAAKGAIASLTVTMAAYYAPHRIRVNAVAPSLTRTPMAGRAASDPATVAFVDWKQPLVGGLLEPEDIADAAAFLLSGEARAITGQVLKVDGGFSVTESPPERGPQ